VANWGKIGEPLSMLCINLQLVNWMWRGLCINLRKMMDLQQHYNNYTTLLYMRVEPSVWSPPHVKGCCVIVVVLLCRNQTPKFNSFRGRDCMF
jgi:hypothetical protein